VKTMVGERTLLTKSEIIITILFLNVDKRDQDKADDSIETSESKPHASSGIELGQRTRETKVVEPTEQISSDDIEKQKLFSADEKFAPPKVLEPIRSDPVNALHARQRRLERLSIENMPEYHFIGQICSGRGIVSDSSEGAYCRCNCMSIIATVI
jgi:hypothetical protein